MAFKVKSFKELLTMSQEKLDEALAPIRARAAKAKADVVIAELEEEKLTLESEIHQLCAEKELNFDTIIAKMDKYDLLERRAKQVTQLISELFPKAK